MTDEASQADVQRPGPSEFRDPLIRQELKKAAVWFSLGLAVLAVIFLAQPLLLIFGGIEVSQNTLLRFYVLHVILLPLTAAIFLAVHFWRIRKDGGISGPL